MSTSVKVLAGVAAVVVIALGVARMATRAGGDSVTPDADVGPEVESLQEVAASPEARTVRPAVAYDQIVERDVFRPLVVAARAAGTGEGGGKSRSAPTGGRSPGKPSEPGKPADPLADLALTGVVQAGQDLQALIERVSTRVGRYVRVGDEIDGFRVAEIREESVLLEKDGTRQTLRMGDKELPEAPSSVPSDANAGSQAGGQGGQQTPGPSGPSGGMTIPGEFGDDMLKWAERTPLSQIERMYDRYSGYMSPEQRRQADEYIQDRRRREGR